MMTTIVLIGMAGAGKTTVGRALAHHSGWAFVDTDALLAAWWGAPLQAVRDRLGLEGFLDAEADGILRLGVHRAVVATGGSVVYRPQAMAHLAHNGYIVHLDAPLEVIRARITDAASRGLAIRPDQSLEDLYAERAPLYGRFAQLRVDTATTPPKKAAAMIWDQFQALEKT